MIKNNEQNNIPENTNNATSIILLEDNKKCQYLLDETYDNINSMKKGEYFYKVMNQKGKTSQNLITLSQNEDYLKIINNNCCKRTYIISLEDISSCEIGHSNNFYSKKKVWKLLYNNS